MKKLLDFCVAVRQSKKSGIIGYLEEFNMMMNSRYRKYGMAVILIRGSCIGDQRHLLFFRAALYSNPKVFCMMTLHRHRTR